MPKLHTALLAILYALLVPALNSVQAAPQAVVDDKLIQTVNSNHQAKISALYQQNEILSAQLQAQLYLQQLSRDDHNFNHKQDWQELNQLNIRARLLMENNLGTFEEYETFLKYLAAKINNSAWENCLQTLNCDFAKIKLGLESKELKAIRQSAVEVRQTREQLLALQERLIEIGEESQGAQGFGELLDALLKVAQSSAQSLNLLSQQVNTLLQLQINDRSARKLEHQTEQAIEERFVKIGTPAGSVTHFDLKVGPYVK